ncbi:hypothetical protein AAC387_Pa08g0255 [Persea americana]
MERSMTMNGSQLADLAERISIESMKLSGESYTNLAQWFILVRVAMEDGFDVCVGKGVEPTGGREDEDGYIDAAEIAIEDGIDVRVGKGEEAASRREGEDGYINATEYGELFGFLEEALAPF